MTTLKTSENAFLVIEIINSEKRISPFFSQDNASVEYHRSVANIKALGKTNSYQNLAVYFVPLIVNNNISMLEFIKTIEENIEFYIKRPLISYIFKLKGH